MSHQLIDSDNTFGASEVPRSRWQSAREWLLLLLLAVAIYEMTAQVPLSAVVFCLKFGIKGLTTALWLRKSDPNRARGYACCFFFIAEAMLFVGITALLLAFAVGIFLPAIQGAQAPLAGIPALTMECIIVFAACLTLMFVPAAMGIVTALIWRVKVWSSRCVHVRRGDGVFPPQNITDQYNDVRMLLMVAAGFPGICFVWFAVVLFACPGPIFGRNAPPWAHSAPVVAAVGALITIVLVLGTVIARVCARSPEECWGPGTGPRTPAANSFVPPAAMGFADLPWYRKILFLLSWGLLGTLALPMFPVLVPIWLLGFALNRLRMRRLRQRWLRSGRMLPWHEARERMTAEGGTLIIEQWAPGSRRANAWWTPDDVVALSPFPLPTAEERQAAVAAKQSLVWDLWCALKFVGEAQNRSYLLKIGRGAVLEPLVQAWAPHVRVVNIRTYGQRPPVTELRKS